MIELGKKEHDMYIMELESAIRVLIALEEGNLDLNEETEQFEESRFIHFGPRRVPPPPPRPF